MALATLQLKVISIILIIKKCLNEAWLSRGMAANLRNEEISILRSSNVKKSHEKLKAK
jgi:hypothetical protein